MNRGIVVGMPRQNGQSEFRTTALGIQSVLFAGTMEDAAMAQDAASPAHTWPEARNPANQWLANLMGAKAHRVRVHNAGVQARKDVRAAYAQAGYPLPPYAPHKPFLG